MSKNDRQQILTALQALESDISTMKDEQRKQGTQMKTVYRKLTRVQKDISLLIKTYNEHIIRLRGRVERLEEHTGLSQPS